MATPTNSKDSPSAGAIQTVLRAAGRRSVLAAAASLAGSVLTIVGFYVWIIAALGGTGEGTGVGQAMFYVGFALAIVGIALAVWSIIRGAPKLVPIVAIALAAAPVLFLLGLQMR